MSKRRCIRIGLQSRSSAYESIGRGGRCLASVERAASDDGRSGAGEKRTPKRKLMERRSRRRLCLTRGFIASSVEETLFLAKKNNNIDCAMKSKVRKRKRVSMRGVDESLSRDGRRGEDWRFAQVLL